jgi:hypothetical protein
VFTAVPRSVPANVVESTTFSTPLHSSAITAAEESTVFFVCFAGAFLQKDDSEKGRKTQSKLLKIKEVTSKKGSTSL